MRARVITAVAIATAVTAIAVSLPFSQRLREAGAALVRPAVLSMRRDRAVTPGEFSARTFSENGIVLPYQIFFPTGYDSSRQWPVIVALHGSGEKGNDGVRQLARGLGPVVKERAATFPAIVIFPQVPGAGQGQVWVPTLMHLVDAAVRDVNGDRARVYLTGLSFGGIMALEMARRNPDYFAALVTISAPVVIQSGARDTRLPDAEAFAMAGQALKNTPVWIFQGAHDEVVPVAVTRQMVGAFKSAGVTAKYTEYSDGTHDIWDRAYRTGELWSWLLAQHR